MQSTASLFPYCRGLIVYRLQDLWVVYKKFGTALGDILSSYVPIGDVKGSTIRRTFWLVLFPLVVFVVLWSMRVGMGLFVWVT